MRRVGYKCRENEINIINSTRIIFCFAVFGHFYFFLAPENFVFGVFVFYVFAISFAMGGVNRKLKKHKKRKHQKQNFREQEKNKNDQKQQNKKYFELS